MSSYDDVTLHENDEATNKMEAKSSKIDFDINMSIAKIRVLICNLKLSGVLLDFVFDDNAKEFQMADKLPVTDSLSMLAEQETQASQDEGGSQPSQPRWECPVLTCNKSYVYEKLLKNHIKKIHDSDDSMDDTFTPRESSTQENAVDMVDDEEANISRKRKKPDDPDYEDDEGELEREMGRARLSSIREESVLELGAESMDRMLDEPSQVEKSTQDLRSEAARAYDMAEAANVDVNMGANDNLDESLERDSDNKIVSLENQLKTKSDLANILNSKVAELEADMGEQKEVNEQLERALKKLAGEKESLAKRVGEVAGEKEALRLAAKKEIDEKEKIIRKETAEKEVLKSDVAKMTAQATQLTNTINNVKKDLNIAKKSSRKAVVDQETYDKVKTSLEATLVEMEEVKREMERYKREMAKAYKRIPCTIPDCDRPRDCEYSHKLKYEDKSAPREGNWKKSIPCRFENYPDGCFKKADECSFLHVGEVRRDDLRDNIRPRGRRDSYQEGEEEGRNLNVSIEVVGQNFGERRVERTDNRGEPSKPRQPYKRMRMGNNNGEELKDQQPGNGRGATGPPPTVAPVRTSRRSSTPSSANTGARARSRSLMRQREERPRNWSPAASPGMERRERERGRSDRQQRWGQGRGRQGQEHRRGGQSVDSRRRDWNQGRSDSRAGRYQDRRGMDPWI